MSTYDGQKIDTSFKKLHFEELPDDILIDISSYCDIRTLCHLSMVCRRFRKVFSSNCVWNRKKDNLTINGCSNDNSICKLTCTLAIFFFIRILEDLLTFLAFLI